VHNNYFLLRKLSGQLKELVSGTTIRECFSQNKDELVLIFQRSELPDFIFQATLLNDFSCIRFPGVYHRAHRNTANIFPEIIGTKVTAVQQVQNERAFYFILTKGYTLLFKLFGNRGNILLVKDNDTVILFKNSLQRDRSLFLPEMHRQMDVRFEHFKEKSWKVKEVLYTLGTEGEKHLLSSGFSGVEDHEKYTMIQKMLSYLEQPEYYIVKTEGKVRLSLFPGPEVLASFCQPAEALNYFYNAHYQYNHYAFLLEKIKNKISTCISGLEAHLSNMEERSESAMNVVPPGQVADIIMANLHSIAPGSEKIMLYDFYRNQDIEVKLKRDLTPQKNAERLYRKEKNRHLELLQLQEEKERVLEQLLHLKEDLALTDTVSDYKSLDTFRSKYLSGKQKEKQAPEMHFKNLEFGGYKILIGRNAENNDVLTQKFAHKNDLWLHARDVSGSHVVIRHQPGKTFPRNVIEKAASIAAFYSKRKNESLCPVIYTEKKYVRKVKGAPKGAVKIDRENVIMVVPADF
jgi:predicted ribosome quality control (RQC) complex YloA/Tae2 family protein